MFDMQGRKALFHLERRLRHQEKIAAFTELMINGTITSDEFTRVVAALDGSAAAEPEKEKSPAEEAYGRYIMNNLCSWLKRYLWRFTGMDPANLHSCLNWYVYLFRVNQAREKWPRTARVVRHLVMADSHYRT